jgi:hypothetical protein
MEETVDVLVELDLGSSCSSINVDSSLSWFRVGIIGIVD